MRLEPIASLVSDVNNVNPAELGRPHITYLDISSVDNLTKRLVAPQRIAANAAPSRARQLVHSDDVLVSTVRPNLNAVALVPTQFNGEIASTGFCVLRAQPKQLCPQYLFFFTQSAVFIRYLTTVATGASYPAVTDNDILETRIPLPALFEQRRIARQLEEADRLRHTSRHALDFTDAFLPAAFLEIFGDPATNPRGFARVQVESLFAEGRDGAKCGPFGSALKKQEYVPSGIPVWTMNNVGANEFVEEGCLYITPQKFEELAAYDAQNGDILISRAGTVGRMAIVSTRHPRSIIHSNIIRLSLNPALVLPIYFVSLMTWFASRVAKLKRGQEDAYTFMSTGSLGELQIQLPPLPVQQKFAAVVARLERLRAVQREALRQAEHLFASLLDRAFSG